MKEILILLAIISSTVGVWLKKRPVIRAAGWVVYSVSCILLFIGNYKERGMEFLKENLLPVIALASFLVIGCLILFIAEKKKLQEKGEGKDNRNEWKQETSIGNCHKPNRKTVW